MLCFETLTINSLLCKIAITYYFDLQRSDIVSKILTN